MRFLSILCVLAIALCLTASVYAETQSVKVSGDLTIRGISRAGYDLRGSTPEPDVTRTGMTADTGGMVGAVAGIGGQPGTNQAYFMSTTEVQIDADMTDNVSTVIRLVNQRDWNVRGKAIAQGTTMAPNGYGGYNVATAGSATADEYQVSVDLAYVVLKDFIYAPLTLTIGRQDLWFGKGFIVGLNQQNPSNIINAAEYTAINSFDAIKAVLDYDPWTITSVYSKIQDNSIATDDDTDLYGVNVGYKFDVYKAEAEGYWFFKKDGSIEKWGGNKATNDVHTLGLRGSFDPIDVLTVSAEGAYQMGSYVGTRSQLNDRDRGAYALDLGAEWRFLADKFAWKPKLGVEYVLYSGNEAESNLDASNGDNTGWDPMYRGKFDSAIREFVGRYYATYDFAARPGQQVSCADASFTNQHQVIFSGSIMPIESLTLKGNFNLFWNQEDYTFTNSQTFIGTEVDLQANWDYTEDVSFNLLTGWFIPGEVYTNADKVATDVVGTVKVNF